VAYLQRVSDALYETTDTCPWCTAIDHALEHMLADKTGPVEGGRDLDELSKLLVNGYGFVHAVEGNGVVTGSQVSAAERMPLYTDDVLLRFAKEGVGLDVEFNPTKAQQATVVFGRWCAACGARKHDVIDAKLWARLYTGVLPAEQLNVTCTVDGTTVHVKWTTLDQLGYPVPGARLVLTRRPDVGAGVQAGGEVEFDSTTGELDDVPPDNGRAYVYTATLLDEHGDEVCSASATAWLEVTPVNGYPKALLGLGLLRSRHLELDDNGEYVVVDELVGLPEVDPTDQAYGGVLLRWNADHVPDQDWHAGDHDFDENQRLRVVNLPERFFLKPLVYSRLFRRDGVDDHQEFPELRLWNTDTPAQLVSWRAFEDVLVDLTFTDGRRSMTVDWRIIMPPPDGLEYFRVLLKQTDEWIVDGLAEGYKVIDVPFVHGVDRYRVEFDGLAAGMWWTCGVFPVYSDSTPDVRLEYQHRVEVAPMGVVGDHRYGVGFEDFYYTGKWVLADDRGGFKGEPGEVDHQVMTADLLNVGQVAPLLVRLTDAADAVEVTFDYKVLTRDNSARFAVFVNDQCLLTTTDTGNRWAHATLKACGTRGLTVRWEYMRAPWHALPCNVAMVDNVVIHGLPVVDDKTTNFTRTDAIYVLQEYLFNRRIRFNGEQKYTADKISVTRVVIDPYVVNEGVMDTVPPSSPGPWVNVDW